MKLKKKLPAKYASVLVPFFLSMIMTCLVCFINIVRLVGLNEGFVSKWFAGWMMAWLISFPTVLVVLPLVKKMLSYIVEIPKDQ
jgi:hypothetical protein